MIGEPELARRFWTFAGLALDSGRLSAHLYTIAQKYYIITYFEKFCNKLFGSRESGIGSRESGAGKLLPIASCLLPLASCLLPIASCLLPPLLPT
ncbi:MAG: hypothetical protein F6J90_22920 [Moorea sp. SIOASIH]|uniref:hypothetical protein n=1 Tax=Moorena sp. SIOASIH TaxID=2607817 RepID=UPI0013BE3007|nr:hypothetical protein [Moorena sp. SIOASIH]NEO39034.1 hypothetical protein [Moorena sp. SIOASIH]